MPCFSSCFVILFCGILQRRHAWREISCPRTTTVEHHAFLLAAYAARSLSLGRVYLLTLMCGAPVTGLFRARNPPTRNQETGPSGRTSTERPPAPRQGRGGSPPVDGLPWLAVFSSCWVTPWLACGFAGESRYLTGADGATGPAYK